VRLLNITLIGTLKFKLGNVNEAISYLDIAMNLDTNISEFTPALIANYIEVLRFNGDLDRARKIGYSAIDRLRKARSQQYSSRNIFNLCTSCSEKSKKVETPWIGVFFNLAIVEIAKNQPRNAIKLYKEVIEYFPDHISAYRLCATLMVDRISPVEAENFLKDALRIFPTDYQLKFIMGGVINCFLSFVYFLNVTNS